MSLSEQLRDDMKDAMRARDKDRLGVIRMALAAVKQREIDDRCSLDDAGVVAVLDKMVKQRRESVAQFRSGGRDDLADKEQAEIAVLTAYLPEPLSDAALGQLIDAAIEAAGATSIRDMGKVMGALKKDTKGRADMAAVSAKVKARLTG